MGGHRRGPLLHEGAGGCGGADEGGLVDGAAELGESRHRVLHLALSLTPPESSHVASFCIFTRVVSSPGTSLNRVAIIPNHVFFCSEMGWGKTIGGGPVLVGGRSPPWVRTIGSPLLQGAYQLLINRPPPRLPPFAHPAISTPSLFRCRQPISRPQLPLSFLSLWPLPLFAVLLCPTESRLELAVVEAAVAGRCVAGRC